jgi:HD-like signal output (HDOD) protein/CheY-like chemotaxis protein
MKCRILFVDDEPMVLQGFRRMMRPFRDKWETQFVESGLQALALMEQERFDVLVTDMMMPGLSGADLLEQVRQRYPRTVRLILSGHAERALVLKCVNSAHRFLAKPCEPEVLTAALSHAATIALTFQNEQLAALVGHIDRLPSPPAFYFELQQRLESPVVSVEEIGAIIAKDLSMTAQVLKLVNSAFFGLPQKIATPSEAVAYLGLDVVRALVLSLQLMRESKTHGVSVGFIDELWRHSLQVSAGARRIAEMEQAKNSVVNEAAAAGLLHDTGKLIFVINGADRVQQANQRARAQGIALPDAEREVFGCTHAEVGGHLFNLWGLPKPVVRAVALHHAPTPEPGESFGALTAVHVADVLMHQSLGQWEGGAPLEIDHAYLAAGGWTDRLPVWMETIRSEARPTVR